MYPHMIEVHQGSDNAPMMVNVDVIESIYPHYSGSQINTISSEGWVTQESYDEVKELLRSAGTAIQKGDPRIDTTHNLSMDDLCETMMIGEPVWNSNTRAWMLVVDSSLGDVHRWVDLCDHCGKIVRYEPQDVIKYPLYRLRKEL